jgi:hypothetical protein
VLQESVDEDAIGAAVATAGNRATLWHQMWTILYQKEQYVTTWEPADRLKIDRWAVRPRPWPPPVML